VFFGCLLAHELAHCVVARRNGVRIVGITLFLFGGMAKMGAEPERPSHEFYMAAAGPAMSLALAGAAFGGAYGAHAPGGHEAANAALYLAVANLALCVFNLLPAFPMDGGRILRAGLWAVWRDLERATAAASRLSRGLGLLLIAGGLYLGVALGAWNGLLLMLMGGFLIHSAEASYQQVRLRRRLAGWRVSGLMGSAPPPLPAELSVADALARWDGREESEVASVYAEGRLVGLVDFDTVASVAAVERAFVPVSRLMRAPRRAELVRAESAAWEALRKMARTGRRQLYVIRHGALLGVLHVEELLATVAGARADVSGRGRG
jgi:Zn-dependent protease